MMKTSFAARCEILGTLWMTYAANIDDDENWRDFFRWANVGLPLAYMGWQGFATVKADGKPVVDSTWSVFCAVIGIDENAKYATLEDAFHASPNLILGDFGPTVAEIED